MTRLICKRDGTTERKSFVEPVRTPIILNKGGNWEKLKTILKSKGIISNFSEVE